MLFASGTSALDASRVPERIPFICVNRHCADGIIVENDTVAMLHDMTERHVKDMARLGAVALVKAINGEVVERRTIVPHEVIARETTVRA